MRSLEGIDLRVFWIPKVNLVQSSIARVAANGKGEAGILIDGNVVGAAVLRVVRVHVQSRNLPGRAPGGPCVAKPRKVKDLDAVPRVAVAHDVCMILPGSQPNKWVRDEKSESNAGTNAAGIAPRHSAKAGWIKQCPQLGIPPFPGCSS